MSSFTRTVRYALLASALLSSFCLADDDWVCREVASKRESHAILACGIGQAATEAGAREEALRNAKNEFKGICEVSADCRDHETVLEPLRNECKALKEGYRCYRAFRFNILDRLMANTPAVAPATPAEQAAAPRAPASEEPTSVTGKLLDRSRDKHFLMGVKLGAASSTIETGGRGYLAVPFILEWKWDRVGLRFGLETDSASAKDTSSNAYDLSGWQAFVALPIYLLDLENHALVFIPQIKASKQTYSLPNSLSGVETTYWQRGYGAGLEYRLSLGSVVRLVAGIDGIRYGDDNGASGAFSWAASAGILLFL